VTPRARSLYPKLSTLAILVVCLSAVLPYLVTVRDYFVADDFGVVQILSQKPAWYFPRWFVGSWMENVFGVPPQEIRPFPAVSYQLTALAGSTSPTVHHVVNILIHAVNGVLALTIARQVAGLSLPAATAAAVLFVILPVQVESVAWITGRVDSLPALFYLASFLAYAEWRTVGSHARSRYVISVALFFAALFSKENTITMLATLVLYDSLVARRDARPSWMTARAYFPYVPYLLLTVGFLLLRYTLFGDLVRESELQPGAFASFGDRVGRHVQRIVLGGLGAGAPMIWTALLIAAGLVLGIWRKWVPLYFGPLWTIVALIPTIAAGYESPRHLYLAALGWVMLLGFAFQSLWTREGSVRTRAIAGAFAVAAVAGYLVVLRIPLANLHAAATISEAAAADLQQEASSAVPGTLVIVGAPLRSWEWALPLVARPPFSSEDLTKRVFIVSPWLLHCCRTEWLDDTHRTLRAWSGQPVLKPILILHWDNVNGRLSRLTDTDYPDLRTAIPVLIEENTVDYLDRLILRLTNELAPRPTRD
jgi:hypothetical protein